MRYKLGVPDAIVIVWQGEKVWRWSFRWVDDSGNSVSWHPIERMAKSQAKEYYELKTRKRIKRARWIRIGENNGN